MILSSVLAIMSNHTFPGVTSPRITGGIPKAAQHTVKLHQTLATYLSLNVLWILSTFSLFKERGQNSSNWCQILEQRPQFNCVCPAAC